MRIILEVDPGDIDWKKGTYARISHEVAEAWGQPQQWDEVEFNLVGEFHGHRISFYDEDDEWEAVKFIMEVSR